MSISEQQWRVYHMMCCYHQYKTLFPEVILNYAHRKPAAEGFEPFTLDEADEVLSRFRQSPNQESFTSVFNLLKAIDQTIDAAPARQHLFDDGVLRTGER